jgi:Ohr subfamily peroxiredoxin
VKAKLSEVQYQAVVTVTGGRVGHAESNDGLLSLDLARPGASSGANPEQLLAAGWGACFLSTMAAIARRSELDAGDATAEVRVDLGKTSEGFFGLRAAILVNLPRLDDETATGLMKEAHERCPYSRALSSSIEVDLRLRP